MIEALKLAIASDRYLNYSVNVLVEKSDMDEEVLEDLLREFMQELHDDWAGEIEPSAASAVFLAITQSAVHGLDVEELARWAIARYKDQYC